METIELKRAAPSSPVRRTELDVSGMNCSGCARHVTDALQSVPGVASATVSLEKNQASVRWAAESPGSAEALVQAVEKAGYRARLLPDSRRSPTGSVEAGPSRARRWQTSVILGVISTAFLMIGEWVFRWHGETWYRWSSFALATVVQFGPGRQFYRGAWNQLKAGSSNMDTLVALGSTTAFAYSVWALFSAPGTHLYFMEAAAIITLISVGHWAEARVSERASTSLKALMHLAPSMALRRMSSASANEEAEEVPVAELQPGDRIVLKPGARIPTDGEVVEGGSAVDEAMLTGESNPVDKATGSTLYAGTVNINGRLLMRVTSVGEDTALSQVIAAVQRAQSSRADIQRLGDRVSSVFVPIVVLTAVAAAIWWGLLPDHAHAVAGWLGNFLWDAHPPSTRLAAAVITAAAVLIVACPCAMGLATPAAIMAGANAAARRGILIRDGIALEKAGTITTVLFDKTGTLTLGRPSVAGIEVLDGSSSGGGVEFPAVRLASSLGRHSSHPVSRAVASLSAESIALDQWEEIRGRGVQARVKDRSGAVHIARLGSLNWLREAGVIFPPPTTAIPFVESWAAQGATVLGLARDGQLAALIALKDQLKEGAREVVATLQRQKLNVYLVTGDLRRTALGISAQLGITEDGVFAEVRPEQKAGLVKRLQEQGQKVAFVGDGINDGPALEQADLGVAVSRASDVAREAADIVLLNSEIEAVPESLGLARATLRTIKQNLFWAFFYNALGIPLAALGFMSPVLCAAAMGLSDLVVIGNALRLRAWKP